MAALHERAPAAQLKERLATAEQLLAAGRDRDGMHWLWAAAAGLDGDPDQVQAVLAVAQQARSTTRGSKVRSECGVLIARLQPQLRAPSLADDARPAVQRSAGAPTPRNTRAAAYYLDERLSLAEGTGRFSTEGGRETVEEGFFVIAIRRSGARECLFRFPDRDRADARLMVESLNRSAARAAL